MAIQDKFLPVGEVPGHLSVLIWGRSGTGKTTLAGDFPKPLLLVDVREQGTDGLRNVPGIDVLPLETWDELQELYWYLVAGEHPYKTLVIDTVTQLQDVALEKVLKDEGKTIDSPITQSNWGAMAKMMKSWMLSFRDLPMHTVFLAQDRVNNVEGFADQMVPEVGPRLSPSVAGMLNAAVKVICQTFIQEDTRRGKDNRIHRVITYRLRVGPHPLYLTKVRQPRGCELPPDIIDPTFEKLNSIIQGRWGQPAEEAESADDAPKEQQSIKPQAPQLKRKGLRTLNTP